MFWRECSVGFRGIFIYNNNTTAPLFVCNICDSMMAFIYAAVVKLVYTRDLKSLDRKVVRVRPPPAAPTKNRQIKSGRFLIKRRKGF